MEGGISPSSADMSVKASIPSVVTLKRLTACEVTGGSVGVSPLLSVLIFTDSVTTHTHHKESSIISNFYYCRL